MAIFQLIDINHQTKTPFNFMQIYMDYTFIQLKSVTDSSPIYIKMHMLKNILNTKASKMWHEMPFIKNKSGRRIWLQMLSKMIFKYS